MSGIFADLKLALLMFRKRPLLHFTIVAMLAAGVAGNAAIFSIFNSLFLKPLPFSEPKRLVNLDETAPKWNLEFVSISYPDFHAWREHNRTFDSMALYRDESFNLALDGEPRRILVARVTHDLGRVLRLAPLFGRHFTAEEDTPGAPKVTLIGEALWQEQFGGRPDVLGETLHLDSVAHTIVGVLPSEARFIDDTELWVPLATDVDENPGSWYLSGIGRLAPNATVDEARADLTRIHRNLIEERSVNEITTPVVLPILDRFVGEYRRGTLALLFGVGLVLLMACGNVAGLMWVRSSSRQQEMGVRLALGARRGRIVRQLLTESFLLAVAGGAVGVWLGRSALGALVLRMPDEIPTWIDFELDLRFLCFTLVVLVGVAVLSGLSPALRAARTNVQEALKLSPRSATSDRGHRFRLATLVAAEVAVALALSIGAALVAQSFREVMDVDPGFRPEGVLTYRVSLPELRYERDARGAFIAQHLADVGAIPAVLGAGAVNSAPFGNHEGGFFEIENAPPKDPDAPSPVVLARSATAGYFRAMGVELSAGRVFRDDPSDENSVVVNETFVQTFWPEDAPTSVLGNRIRAGSGGSHYPWLTVVGVTTDVRHYGLDEEMRPGVYQPYQSARNQTMTIVLRSAGDPSSLVGPARDAMRRRDASIPLYRTATMVERMESSLWPRRASTWLISWFSLFSLGLAVSGIYGVTAHAVRERGREVSIRIALGARSHQLLSAVLVEGMLPVAAGVAVGLVGTFVASRGLSTFLFGVTASDIRVYGAVTTVVVIAAFLANFLPARRAARSDPMDALRAE